jgi:L-ascorbate metabolism protein UlaG (beta-lactamase superfamily)
MQRNRRKFLSCMAAGLTASVGGAGWWVSSSQRRAARWARRLASEARRRIQPPPFRPEPASWSDNKITLAWLGHSTVLINFYGLTILTDPALGNHIGVSLGLGTIGPKRFIAPALTAKELPPIDILLLSHAHMDHMDLPTLRRFPRSTFTISAKTTTDLLADVGLGQVTELGWNERAAFRNSTGDLQVEAVQVKHWGQRWPSELARGYNGYILRREGKAILFGGDTALTPALGDLKPRGPFALAIMPIGAYRPWIRNHCTPEQAMKMADAAGANYLVPVHHQTFQLSEEPMTEPIERLQEALRHEPDRLALRSVGQTFECPLS